MVTQALAEASWDEMTQIRMEVSFAKGRMTDIIVNALGSR
jgi:hypothetical protein